MGGHPSACKAGHQRYRAQRDELRLRSGTDDYLIHIDVGWLVDREIGDLLDPFVFGAAAGPVHGVRRHHPEHGLALVFGEARRPCRSRRSISQRAVLEIELTLVFAPPVVRDL